MSRLHTDPVEVRTSADEPHQFLWRGRLYLVREVLGHWAEAGGWWRTSAVQALTSGEHTAPRSAGPAGDAVGGGGVRSGPAAEGLVRDGAAGGGAAAGPVDGSLVDGSLADGGEGVDRGREVDGVLGIDDGSQEWWRVEAGTGRSGTTGVYDLCFDWSRGAWALARVLD